MKSYLILLWILVLGYSSCQLIDDDYDYDFTRNQRRPQRPIYDYEDELVARKSSKVAPRKEQSKKTYAPLPLIVKQINNMNEDGSYTFGYESEDGSYRVETRDVIGNTRGKYGYVDAAGELREVEYSAGPTGFSPSGDDIKVPPPAPPPRPTTRPEIVDQSKVSQGRTRSNLQRKIVQDYDIDYADDLAEIQSNIRGNSGRNFQAKNDDFRNEGITNARRDVQSEPILQLNIEYPNVGKMQNERRIVNFDKIMNEEREFIVKNRNNERNSNRGILNARRNPRLRIEEEEKVSNVRNRDEKRDFNFRVPTSKTEKNRDLLEIFKNFFDK